MLRALVVLIAGCGLVFGQGYLPNLPVDSYWQATPDDPVARLVRTRGTADLPAGGLPELLGALGISVDSQALVFSKTSFQSARISPRNPRAVYFNDSVAVAWVRGSPLMEVAAVDPRHGVMFYTFENGKFERRRVCLQCHQGPATMGVPGIFVGSVFPDVSGMPSRDGAIITDHRTPFADRWGGWYVNALRGQQPDRANGVAADPSEPHLLRAKQNLSSLVREFDPHGYLSPVSDIVALMTLEHQTQATNLITRVAWLARMNKPFDADLEALVRYLLFAGEAPLPEPIEGISTFAASFPLRGPRDPKGRSLRDFDLRTRLFRYPVSYMVYSEAFEALPESIRERIWRRVRDELKDRPDVLEILRDTKAGI